MNISIDVSGTEPIWPDLADRKDLLLADPNWQVGVLRHGMQSGRTSVALRLTLSNGQTVVAEQSLAQMVMLGAALKGYAERIGEL